VKISITNNAPENKIEEIENASDEVVIYGISI